MQKRKYILNISLKREFCIKIKFEKYFKSHFISFIFTGIFFCVHEKQKENCIDLK